ncbi:peptidoglycan-binding protein [Crenothrix sp.]|uniref:peptidoglycan-binding domain-containing protein n=1 Tax=Crenothrix sp. TaxID=3100433 RepID=UPI00374DC35C
MSSMASGTEFYPVDFAAGYNPITQQAQTNLTAQGFSPGALDGMLNKDTTATIVAFQDTSDLPVTGVLDNTTLANLAITTSDDKTPPVQNWRSMPTQDEVDLLVSTSAYADYVANAPGVNLDIPGVAILEAMNQSADTFGSRRLGELGHTDKGHKATTACLKTLKSSAQWSDITLHYYCQMTLPRRCYSLATWGQSTDGVPLSRTNAYAGCTKGELAWSSDFTWVATNQPLVFQFVMFGQAHAFNHDQEQSVINAFYGVEHPNDPEECRLKRPRRAIDPIDGSHCLANKTMLKSLVGTGF